MVKRLSTFFCELGPAYKVRMVECEVPGAITYHAALQKISLGNFKSRENILKQTVLFKALKYFKLITNSIWYLTTKKGGIIYVIDLPTLNLFLILKPVFFFKQNHIIYHQFEILDVEDFNMFNKLNFILFKRLKGGLDTFIAPEINRIAYFSETTGFDASSALMFPNTTNTAKPTSQESIKRNIITIGHVGIAGHNHYLKEFLEMLNKLEGANDFRVLFIGHLGKDAISLIQSYELPMIELEGDVAHEDLEKMYGEIDVGIILYRDLGVNYQFCAPNKLYEYWANGIPVIAHELDGLKGVFKYEEQGTLTNMDDPKRFQECMSGLLKDSQNFDRSALTSIFKSEFDISNYLKQFKSILPIHE